MLRNSIFAAAAAALLTQTAWADGAAGPLAPGQPAGVHQAQLANTNTMIFIGLGVLVVGAGLYLASGTYKIPGSNQSNAATSTSP
jgi:hypothetical protein